MSFYSFAFAFLVVAAFTLYWAFPGKYCSYILLGISYIFYASFGISYLWVLLVITGIGYVTGIGIEKYGGLKQILIIALLVILSFLFVFKYYNFFGASISSLFALLSFDKQMPTISLLMPVGISFYTFQSIGYLADVYQGKAEAEHNLVKYALFVSFFPQVLSGPINRAGSLLPQLEEKQTFDYNQATYGLKQMAWGYFQKFVLADTLAMVTDSVYNNITSYRGFVLVIVPLFYTIQIYCDFAGYSNIALGVAKLFGIRMMENFKSPYLSASLKEFWSRWHISLSTWFRDYFYIPLGGNRVSKPKHYWNLFLTFLLSGLWHGADWTYIIWGALHGAGQVFETAFLSKKHGTNTNRRLRTLLTFVFVNIGWIFFRANSLSDAWYTFTHWTDGINGGISYLYQGYLSLGITKGVLFEIVLFTFVVFLFDFFNKKKDVLQEMGKWNIAIRYAVYFVVLLVIMFFRAQSSAEFVYLQF